MPKYLVVYQRRGKRQLTELTFEADNYWDAHLKAPRHIRHLEMSWQRLGVPELTEEKDDA
jgi:hypothetical protein